MKKIALFIANKYSKNDTPGFENHLFRGLKNRTF